MVAKKGTKMKKVNGPGIDTSDQEVDLETMEKMLDGESDSGDDFEALNQKYVHSSESEESMKDHSDQDEKLEEMADKEESSADENDYNVDEKGGPGLEGEEKCNLDLRNLSAFNSHQVNSRSLYKKKIKDHGEVTIFTRGMDIANEEYLVGKASEGCAQLLAGLWSLDTEKTDAGPRAMLPRSETLTPRALVSKNLFLTNFKKKRIKVVKYLILRIAATTTQSRNKMGKIRQRTWHHDQGEKVTQGVG